jgi:hypothetical protein
MRIARLALLAAFPAACSGVADRSADTVTEGGVEIEAENFASRGSMGLNLTGVADWSTQFPFIDLVKQSRYWSRGTLTLDGDGWLRGNGADRHLIFLTDTNSHPAPGFLQKFEVRTSGKGKFRAGWGVRVLQESVGRMTIELVGRGSHSLEILEVDAQNPLRMSIVSTERVARFDRGEIFEPRFLERLRGVRALRFMDWMHTNDSKSKTWSARPRPAARSWADGVPVEIMVRLANEIGADPWFNMPHEADDGFVREFAKSVRGTLDKRLVSYVEYSNEVWNWQFQQAQYALAEAKKRWPNVGTGWVQYNAMRAARTCQIWKHEVYGTEAKRVHCTLGLHTGWEGIAADTIDCPAYRAEGKKACHQYGIDSIAITGYVGACLNGRVGDHDVSAQLRAWLSRPDRVQRGLEQIKDGRHLRGPNGERCDDTLDRLAGRYARFQALAKQRGLSLVVYEGGSHATANGFPLQDDDAYTAYLAELHRAEGMAGAYRENFRLWREAKGAIYMHFTDIGAPTKHGAWGLLEVVNQPATPRWNAFREANAVKCWWPGC